MRALPLLAERLLQLYPPDHETILYEASPYPVCDPIIQRLPLEAVGNEEMSPVVTMVLPPRDEPQFDQDMLERVRRLVSRPRAT
jgi:hypothetical protein